MTPKQYLFEAVGLDMTREGYREVKLKASMRLLHAQVGIGGESGEIQDLIKKHVFGGKPLDRDKVREEVGDQLWYLALLLHEVGLTFEEVMVANIAKLKARYPDSRDKYQGRDESAEREAVREALDEDCLDSPNEWGPTTRRDVRTAATNDAVYVSGPPMITEDEDVFIKVWEKLTIVDLPGWFQIEVGQDPDDMDPPQDPE